METAKKCYDFLISPQPVVDFQTFCSIRRKHNYDECLHSTDVCNEKQCNDICCCVKTTSESLIINSKENHTNTFVGNSLSNGHYDSPDSINPSTEHGVKNRKPNTNINGYTNTFYDINQNGTVCHNGDIFTQSQKEAFAPEYIIGNYLIFAIFRFGAELGNEFFYLIFYTWSMWNFDSLVCLKIVLVWVLVMYVGQSLKDVIRWPRPASPPVFQLEDRYALEYGMPSTHAMVGTAIPFMLLLFTTDRYEYSFIVGVVIAISWCTLVCLSRLYLGMHTILDILAGLLLVTILMAILVPWAEVAVLFLVTHQFGGLVSLGAAVALAVFYPSHDRWSSARGDTTVFLGVASGMLFGPWINHQQGLLIASDVTLPYLNTLMEFSWDWVKYGIYRMLVGVVATMIIRTGLKLLMFNLLCYALKQDPKDPQTKTCLAVEMPYKYLSYFSLAVCATYIAPLIFTYLEIGRPSYYSEIL